MTVHAFADDVTIESFHSHVYFDASSVVQARRLCEEAGVRFGVTVGRMHQRLVGPHPDWSCQLAYPVDKFLDVMSFLALNRGSLVIFTHPETGDELTDHRDRAIWMGAVRPLNLEIFRSEQAPPAD
jgi:DOPA 4,5-dioxygenase